MTLVPDLSGNTSGVDPEFAPRRDGTPAYPYSVTNVTVGGVAYATSTTGSGNIAPTSSVVPIVRTIPTIFNGTAYAIAVSITGATADGSNVAASTIAPTSAAQNGLTRQFTSVAAGSIILKTSAGNLYGYNIVSGASAGYVMIFDSATVPADGTVTPKMCFAIAANASIQADRTIPIRFTAGIVIVFSTTGPFTKTISGTAFLAGDFV